MKRQWLLAVVWSGTIVATTDSPAAGIYQQLPGAAELGFLIAEPGALALLGLGIALLAIVWRSRK
jgi:hypothetical protein